MELPPLTICTVWVTEVKPDAVTFTSYWPGSKLTYADLTGRVGGRITSCTSAYVADCDGRAGNRGIALVGNIDLQVAGDLPKREHAGK